MKISSGISELSISRMNNSSIEREKIYLWPKYSSGKVDSIRKISRHDGRDIYYTKASESERQNVLESLKKPHFSEYSSNAGLRKGPETIRPGMLFDALV